MRYRIIIDKITNDNTVVKTSHMLIEELSKNRDWDYSGMGDLTVWTQRDWNQTLLTKINKLNGRLPNRNNPIEVTYSFNLKPLIESLMFIDGYIFTEDNSTENVINSKHMFKINNYE